MKKYLLLFFLAYSISGIAQELILKKGKVIDVIPVNDSISESYALYLPTNFETTKEWPIVFVFDLENKGRQALRLLKASAEEEGFVLATPNNVNDSLSISKNILIASRMMKSVYETLPIQNNGVYTAGFSSGARFASLIPTFIRDVNGVISCGSSVANYEVLSIKKPFHFIGIVGNEDYNYTEMLSNQKVLNKLKFPNNLILFNGGHIWPGNENLSKALQTFKLSSMAKGDILKDSVYIKNAYENDFIKAKSLAVENPLIAYGILKEMNAIYRPLMNIEPLQKYTSELKKTKIYRSHNRNQNGVFFKETFIKEDYVYYLEEDIRTYNYNNLGWWKYQTDELVKYNASPNLYERQMGKRLDMYINDLIADNIDVIEAEAQIDEEALNFLWMLNTITKPKKYDSYLKVISFNAKVEDYGTALFYLEELLKNGYTNKSKLYSLENTALFKITPEFNKVVSKYLKEARYQINEE